MKIEKKTVFSTKAASRSGLTLVEMMVTMGVFMITFAALIYANMYGMHLDHFVESKLGASQSSRQGFDQLLRDVRSAKIWRLGNGDLSAFNQITNNQTQRANALQVSLTDNTNIYVRYFFDTNNFQLCRTTNGASSYTVIAKSLTNSYYFYGEDFQGNLQDDLSYKYVIHVTLQFSQYQYPMTKVGANYFYDYYKMDFKVASHNPN